MAKINTDRPKLPHSTISVKQMQNKRENSTAAEPLNVKLRLDRY